MQRVFDIEVLGKLVDGFFEADEKHYIHSEWHKIRSASWYAACEGYLDLYRFALQDQNTKRSASCHCLCAASYGHLHIVKYASKIDFPCIEDIAELAAQRGYLHILKWAYSNGLLKSFNCCAIAAQFGHLHILKWAYKHNMNLDVKACISAARRGNRMLKWAKIRGFPCFEAGKGGHLNILKWVRKRGCP